MKTTEYQPKTGVKCSCKRGQQRDNCSMCEGTGWQIDFKAIRERREQHTEFPTVTSWQYTHDTMTIARALPRGTVSEQSHALGMRQGEPLIVMMDALMQYAGSYAGRFESKLSDDSVLGDAWLDAAKAIRALLNGDGATAMQLNRTTDSKDNGAVEAMFWRAMEIAGFEGRDLC